MIDDLTLQRRQVFQGLIALSAVGGLAACGGAEEAPSGQLSNPPSGLLNAEQIALIAAVAQTIIPQTETAGAVQAGVPDVLQSLVTDWGDTEYQQYWQTGLDTLAVSLTSPDGAAYTSLSPSEREAVLGAYDARVFAGEVEDGFYRDLKATAVQAYYMSEPGASEELAYEPVPGEWIGCVPLSDFPKTWAT